MLTLRHLLATVLTMVAASACLTVGDAGAASAPVQLRQLHEMRTSHNLGWFYTLDAGEADRAAREWGFRPTFTFGLLPTTPGRGRTAIHRLRSKAFSSYMLSISPREWGDQRFVDEGVMGYIDSSSHPEQSKLLRFSKKGQWAVQQDTPENVNKMVGQGYTLDGSLGWAGFPQP